ncbi:OsmC family protein [Sulfitobacter sabulilitoris]|uniref:OsmC family protein n=1 Tax=Sulfitobacter sabulilitoris TaxID=2562655 RepID=A0A5S3PKW9_9RHOB|nr:OsmC family protein [Sulfitobacter sabulilitoris]TMM54997.1 OsmC family protein [Sulfitobacter sabulilitoris]
MGTLTITYDGDQHCTATDPAKNRSVAMDCPYTGKGEELSPGDLLQAALAGCMLIAMGPTAAREGVDLRDVTVSVVVDSAPPPRIAYRAITVRVRMPPGLTDLQRRKLQRAAESCPIKNSFRETITMRVDFDYPD